MTSTNEELPPPPKPRASPFDYRNTDLVSRLLAATPPYLYNLPLVPHNFFFSEMLRSLVQAKTENANRTSSAPIHHRRSRKRSWVQSQPDYYQQKEPPKIEKPEMPPPSNWLGKTEKTNAYPNRLPERPLELTTDKYNVNINTKVNSSEIHPDPRLMQHQNLDFNSEKQELKPNPIHFPFPPASQQTPPSSDLILPPPPPVWYPPLYPSPYAIDPLHFFIDLRVSGHIYDRKNQNDNSNSPHTTTSATSPSPGTSTITQEPITKLPNSIDNLQDTFRLSRHASAFSVPSSRLNRNGPINLTNYSQIKACNESKLSSQTKDSTGRTKFDVKSLGFERSCNKTSLNYVVNNVQRIYREVNPLSFKSEPDIKNEEKEELKTTEKERVDETEEEKEKKVKDLRALIGLELVVDYMNHAKPEQRNGNSEESSTDFESVGSPAVDVVAIQEETDGCKI